MKTYANNPPVKYSELNEDHKTSAVNKIAHIVKHSSQFVRSKICSKFPDNQFQFFITSPTSVAVKKK